jgi:hypothetical protein
MTDKRDGAGGGDTPAVPASGENPGDVAAAATDAKAEKSPFERRVFIFKAAFFLSGVAALGYSYYRQQRIREMTDNDPYDPRGGGKGSRRTKAGISDNDPNDPEGGGKGQGRVVQSKPGTGPKSGEPSTGEPKSGESKGGDSTGESQPAPSPDVTPQK